MLEFLSNHESNYGKLIESHFDNAGDITIASGYTSLDIIEEFYPRFLEKVDSGGIARLLVGMAFYEGLSEKKLELLKKLSAELEAFKNGSGVYVPYSRKFHGKIYYFKSDENEDFFVGSSNFSRSGLSANIEYNVPVFDDEYKNKISEFFDYIFHPDVSTSILKADITVRGGKSYASTIEATGLDVLDNYNPDDINPEDYEYIDLDLRRVAKNEKSSLNVYFGKGRWNKKKDTVRPRPWYEIEIISPVEVTTDPLYPKGDFIAYTDDGYVMPMRTQGDYFKNLRSRKPVEKYRGALQIFGMWLKGKLQKSGALTPLTMITDDTLDEYGRDNLRLYKMDDKNYYMEF